MSIKITVSDKVRIPVEGWLLDENGKRQNFHFTVTARRMNTDALGSLLNDPDEMLVPFLQDIVSGWSGVRDEGGDEVEFSADALAALLQIPGLPNLIFTAWLANVGARDAKAKN